MHTTDTPKDRSVAELFGDLSKDLTTLVRQELELARVEVSKKGRDAGLFAGFFGIAGVLAVGAFVAITIAIVAAIAIALPMWAAALIVAVAYGLAAVIAAGAGKDKLAKLSPIPQHSVASVKHDIEAVREGFQRGR